MTFWCIRRVKRSIDEDQPYMKANELQELGVEGPLTRDKARKLKAQLEQQIIKFLSFKTYDKIGPHHTNLLVIELS